MALRGAGLSRQQAAGISYPAATLRPNLRVGMAFPTTGLATTQAVPADLMYAFPIPIPAQGTFRGVAIQVGTAVAGVSAKLGIAAPGADGFPSTLIAECPTPVDCNLAAGTELLADFTAAISFGPRPLFGLVVFNGGAQPVSPPTLQPPAAFIAQWFGASHIGSLTAVAGPSIINRLFRTHTYASAFPATLTGWAAAAGSNPGSPIMCAVTAP